MSSHEVQRVRRCWAPLLALWFLAACAQHEGKLTQVVVAIDADKTVAANLTTVEIAVYDPDATTHAEPTTSATVTLHASKPAPGTADFPFSIGIGKGKADRFVLVVTGYAGDQAVIEQKARVAFVENEVRRVAIYLGNPCYGQLCGDMDSDSWLAKTCDVESGTCGDVPTHETEPVAIGSELDGGIPRESSTDDDGSADSAMPTDAAQDTGALWPTGYALGVVGDSCAINQTLACEGHASRRVLICNRGMWDLFQTCPETARCDSRVGAGQGLCSSIPAACSNKAAGDVCDGKVRRTCSIDLVSLIDNPCPTNAHCSDSAGSASCECDTGYDATSQGSCTDHNDCPAGACSGGSCMDGVGDYSCDCNSGFAGTGTKACTAVLYCPKDACIPGGTCVDAPSWSCHCAAGYSGEGTQSCTNIPDCPTDRCKAPNGTCQDGINTYTCTCNTGFSGPDCATDACNPSPCQHGGTCTRTTQGASCECGVSGYTGARCETDINECATANSCTSPDYPCAQTVAPGYVCQGQFADWPMPDTAPGAKFAPSYDTSTAEIVADKVTGLIWQGTLPPTYTGCTGQYTTGQGQTGDACNWSDAKKYCDGLTLAGQSDWRLPSKIELESIVKTTSYPTIDTGAFPGTAAEWFWTSSALVGAPSAWGIAFSDGFSYGQTTSNSYHVRCVRSPGPSRASTPADRYLVDTNANTVTDTWTSLVWQRLTKTGFIAGTDAKAQCTGGFRLPGLKELLTLVDPTRSNPSINPAFRGETPSQDAPPDKFWTASPYTTASAAWYVNFTYGASTPDNLANMYRVRCVR